MNFSIIDIETDPGLLECTKIHCMSVREFVDSRFDKAFTITDYNEMRAYLELVNIIVGHKIITFDIPILERILQFKIKAKLIDSLGLSWYLYPNRKIHGLDEWGTYFGIEKPPIDDWENLPLEEYIHRCEEDTKINEKLFLNQWQYLLDIYGTEEKAARLSGYISFKLDCAREQGELKWKVDIDVCQENLYNLEQELQKRYDALSAIMPQHTTYKYLEMYKKLYKKDGSLSANGIKWRDLLIEHGLPENYIGTIRMVAEVKSGNPGSHEQLKDWLFSLGWIPTIFKYEKNPDGSNRPIPQINDSMTGEICPNIKLLYGKVPGLDNIEGYFVTRHRIGILEGFLENCDLKNFIKAEISGLTNTLRFKHRKPVVNLPQIPKAYWKEVRSCLIAPSDKWILCGSDMSGLEDTTKRHYMYKYDPAYVNEMMSPDFDPHIDVATVAGLLTKEQGEAHKLYDRTKGKEGKNHKPVRLVAKKGNFACVYGAGPAKLALTMNISMKLATKFHVGYWKRNHSVKKVAAACRVKIVNNQRWLFNPVSQLWYALRADKDRFSTLNQGTGVYCFDSWVRRVRSRNVKICAQFHDEIVFPLPKGKEEEAKKRLTEAIAETNEEMKLNLTLRISIDFGNNYSEIH